MMLQRLLKSISITPSETVFFFFFFYKQKSTSQSFCILKNKHAKYSQIYYFSLTYIWKGDFKEIGFLNILLKRKKKHHSSISIAQNLARTESTKTKPKRRGGGGNQFKLGFLNGITKSMKSKTVKKLFNHNKMQMMI